MTQDSTANQRLAEVLLDRPLVDYIAERRQVTPKLSWRKIARQLAADTDGQVDVTPETLRLWFATEVAA